VASSSSLTVIGALLPLEPASAGSPTCLTSLVQAYMQANDP